MSDTMSSLRTPRRRPTGEAGAAISVLVVGMATIVLCILGLVVDGGRALQAADRAEAIADEAARAGGQALDRAAAVAGEDVLDPAAAVLAARAYIDAAGDDVTGTAYLSGARLITEVEVQTTSIFMAVFGYSTFTGDGSGTIDLTRS